MYRPYCDLCCSLLNLHNAQLAYLHAVGYTAQAFGLEQTTAANGAFTGTFTVLSVPILVGLSGRRVGQTTWIAACTGLLGAQ